MTTKSKKPVTRQKGEHYFADCGGFPRCITCGCDEDDAFVGGEECSFVPKTQTKPQVTATRRPWAADKWATGWTICAPDAHYSICHLEDCNNAEANAALIVEAVNQHAALLAVAEAASKLLGAFSYRVSAVQESRELNAALAALESVRNA